MKIREQILQNKLELPQIIGLNITEDCEAMFRSLWHAYIIHGHHTTERNLVSNAISMTYWAQRIANPKLHNQLLSILSDAGWITVSTRPKNNWSEAWLNPSKLLEYCTQDELDRTRLFYKFSKYKLELHHDDKPYPTDVTSVQGKSQKTGLSKPGFAASGKVKYAFDTVTMFNHKSFVVEQINKGIDNMINQYPQILEDHANYRELGLEIVDSYIYAEDNLYNAGPNRLDQRGRNIRRDLSKIGNPIGFKIMRALLIIPEEHRQRATTRGVINKYLFIAELMGFKSGTVQSKIAFGRECYWTTKQHQNPSEDHMIENIWAYRVYCDLDSAFNTPLLGVLKHRAESGKLKFSDPEIKPYRWIVPNEIDMSASVLGYLGLILNHRPFMERCNILQSEYLNDAWGHDVITNRKQFKTAMRPLYGSQLSAQAMWNEMGIEYTQEEVVAFQHELNHGEFAVATAFKDFLINNAQMTPEMELVVQGESRTTYCNHFHNVGETTTMYDLFDSNSKTIRRIHNTQTRRIPDLQSFRRYGPTGLIHGLDGQSMDSTIYEVIQNFGFAIDIHDAIICDAEACDLARDVYAKQLKLIHTNRTSILQDYIRSLNIPASAIKQFREVMALVEPLEEELCVNPLVLK